MFTAKEIRIANAVYRIGLIDGDLMDEIFKKDALKITNKVLNVYQKEFDNKETTHSFSQWLSNFNPK